MASVSFSLENAQNNVYLEKFISPEHTRKGTETIEDFMIDSKLTIDELQGARIWIQRGVSQQKIVMQCLSNIISEVTDCINSSGLIIQFHKTMVFHLVGVKAD